MLAHAAKSVNIGITCTLDLLDRPLAHSTDALDICILDTVLAGATRMARFHTDGLEVALPLQALHALSLGGLRLRQEVPRLLTAKWHSSFDIVLSRLLI